MKQLILTGLATEQDFASIAQLAKGAKYYLVFNGGDLRVPIAEEAVELVLQGLVTEEEAPSEPVTTGPEIYDSTEGYDEPEPSGDDGVDQI